MKPREIKPDIVYQIVSKKTGEAQGSYSRAYCDEYDFSSVGEARHANCHGMYDDKGHYRIAKYRVTYELLNDDCDNAEDVEPPPPDNRTLQQRLDCVIIDCMLGVKKPR
jgi:hypothetical protein